LKRSIFLATACASLGSVPAFAADKVLVAPTPGWVAPAPAIDTATPGTILPHFDEQVRIDGDVVTIYIETARQLTSPEQLSQAGTLSYNWQPAHGDITFHRVEILRGGKTIDVLNGGKGFSVLQREAGLERRVVDGSLTAVKHIEGLAVGDVLHVTLSISERDSALAGNVQDGLVLLPAPLKLGFGRARLVWPTARAITVKPLMPGVDVTSHPLDGTWSEVVVPLPVAKLAEMPKNAPARFKPVSLLEFTSFPDWASVAKVMAPLYAVKGSIPAGSDLAAKVDAIAARSADPVHRMADALELVQNDVRYQLIAMGNGNYVPQRPMDTWTKRYGDCKAKTVLLLAILDRLGIAAEPVLANIERGDAVVQMAPAALAFDHVFVRAHVGSEDFWLDGTMLGSRLADIRDVPRYGYVLPVADTGSSLIALPTRAHARPDLDADLVWDMTAGPHFPAPYHMTLRYAGPFGEGQRVEQGAEYDEKLTNFAEKAAKTWTGSDSIGKPKAVYDPITAVWTLSVDGVGYPDWNFRDAQYALAITPDLKVVYDAPRDRASWRAIPALIDQPWTAHSHVVTRLPDGGPGGGKAIALTGGETVTLDVPAASWQRTVALKGGEVVDDIISRETGAEIPADKVSATGKAIDTAMNKTARLTLPRAYPQRWDDAARMRTSPALAAVRAIYDQRITEKADAVKAGAEKSDEAGRLADRGWFEERLFNWAAAEADYSRAIAIDATAARYLSRADLRSRRSDHAGALADAQAAYDLEQGNHDARDKLAEELALAGKVDAAIEILPSDPDVTTDDGLNQTLERASVLELGNRHEDALALLDTALDKRGSSAGLRNARCWYQGLRNMALDVALADCNKAIELASDPATYLDSRAMVHFRAGRFQQARADYEAALASSPEMSSSLFMSGIVAAKLGDQAKSAALLRAARTVNPDIDHFYLHYGIKP
jgi:transglutaminase-like putative cysteine protease